MILFKTTEFDYVIRMDVTSTWKNVEELHSVRTVKPEVQHVVHSNQKRVPHVDTASWELQM